MSFKIELTEEVIEFILNLPVKMQAKIQRSIELLQAFGYQLPEPHSKKVKTINNLYELRVKQGNNICRLFYFHWKDEIYIITSGYMKKSNKLDRKEIVKAKNIMLQYMEQKK